MKIKSIGVAMAVAGLGVLQQISVAQALTWNWSYTTSNDVIASGQWESDGTTYGQNIIYTIQSISGTRNNIAITGLTTILGSDNKFKWDGANILTSRLGFSYTVASGSPSQFNPYCFGCGSSYAPISNEYFRSGGAGTPIISSSLSPASQTTPEPEPVTIGGAFAVAGFAATMKRKLNKRAGK